MITKKPEIPDNFLQKFIYYKNARSAFEDILLNLIKEDITILLPAFIGFSPKEGSGIFDPILSTGIKYKFYKLNEEILIDIDSVKQLIAQAEGKLAMLVVHYWGYVDPQYKQIVHLCKKEGIIIIEDAAHAFFTEYYGNEICREADYVIYSLHKMFPVGGGYVKNKRRRRI